MIHVSLLLVAAALLALGLLVWRANKASVANRRFAIYAVALAGWTIGIAGTYSAVLADLSLRITFAGASLATPTFLAFVQAFPTRSHQPSKILLSSTYAAGLVFALVSLTTELIAYQPSLTSAGLARRTGALYPFFAVYCFFTLSFALAVLLAKWRASTGLPRLQLHYVCAGALVSIAGGLTTNLLLPIATNRSAYGWLGPHFLLPFVLLIAHATIRHRLMDLRFVVHRGLTVAIATMMSLCPVGVFVIMFWPRLSTEFEAGELFVLVMAIIMATLLVPPTRDLAGRLIDRYVYRTHAPFQKIVSDASKRFARHLDLRALVSLVIDALGSSTESEGIAIYLTNGRIFSRVKAEVRHQSTQFALPELAPMTITAALQQGREFILIDELARDTTDQNKALHLELSRLNWALVLPLRSEHTLMGFIAIGAKLAGDPFFPQDLDLLMTLANQAGIAIKNAQLYTQVVLVNEYIEKIVKTIESGVVAVDEAGHVAMFNPAAERLTGLSAGQVQNQPVDVLPSDLSTILRNTVADGLERTEPEISLQADGVSRPVICTTSQLREPTGVVLGAVAVFSDLTPFKQLENERRRAERLAYFEVLASSLAHEIKNPLVAIKAFAQLVPRRHKDEKFVDEFNRIVTREIGRMERLVERLRALSRPSDRPKVVLDIRGPLGHAVEFLRPAFDEKRIGLNAAFGTEPRTVVGDAPELEELFINLLMNAHEATSPGGSVSIELKVTAEATVVTVADSGPGIPPELLEHVFDPFVTSKPHGSGLGLTISAGIAAAHRAKLLPSNLPGGGALFTVEFPVATQGGLLSEVRDLGMNARA
jgi:PAS domain S-box-containing protein